MGIGQYSELNTTGIGDNPRAFGLPDAVADLIDPNATSGEGSTFPVNVQEVNGQTGADITLTAADVGALSEPLPEVVDGTALPVADPLSAGKLWNNAGVVTVSTGS